MPWGGLNENSIGARDVLRYKKVNGIERLATLFDDHLSHVTLSALNYTSQKVAVISAGMYSSESAVAFSPSALKSVISAEALIDGLDFVIANFSQYNIRVLNLSLGSDFHEGNNSCDSVSYGFERSEIRNKINLLINSGVAVVASAGNTLPVGVEAGLEFPACISRVVSVGGFTVYEGDKILAGATSTSIDFVDEVYYTDTFNNNSIQGTSYASPKVAGMISELMAVNPAKSTSQILQALYATASSSGRIYYPTDRNKYDTGRLVINFQEAIGQLEDSYWKKFIQLIQGVLNTEKIGWNYGTDQHLNGALSYFDTVPLQQASALLNSSKNTSSDSNSSEQVLRFSLKAFDIDTDDEVEVIVNNKFYGHLKTTGSNQLGATQAVCISGSDLTTDGSKNEVKLKLKNSGETWGVTDIEIEVGSIDDTCLGTTNTDPVEAVVRPEVGPIEGGLLNYSDTSRYGRFHGDSDSGDYRVLINFTPEMQTVNVGSLEARRDIEIKFTGAIDTQFTSWGFELLVNGVELEEFNSFNASNELERSFIINRKHLNGASDNEIILRPNNTLLNWGIRDISIKYLPVVPLQVGAKTTSEYGYSGAPTRYTGLRASFEILKTPSSDYTLFATGWDIDVADETEVFVNGNFIGYLNQSSSNNSYAQPNKFSLTLDLLRVGINYIEFVQREPQLGVWFGFGFEKWAVKDIAISDGKSNIVPILMLLLDDD